MDLGANLKNARESAGMTQKELAGVLGNTQKDISRWERNDRTPNVLTLKKICETVGTSADRILEIKI